MSGGHIHLLLLGKTAGWLQTIQKKFFKMKKKWRQIWASMKLRYRRDLGPKFAEKQQVKKDFPDLLEFLAGHA